MNCLIVDDQEIFREVIKGMFEFEPSLVLVGECTNAMEAYHKILNEQIDLVFLDIKMPGINGIELAKILEDKSPLIIFTTSQTEYAVDAFELNVVDFLVKPIAPIRFIKAIERAKDIIRNKNVALNDDTDEFVFIRDSNTTKRIRIKDILFLEATRDYVKIFLADQTCSIHSSLKDVEQKLPAAAFFRVHRSFIVNINKIDTTEGKTLVIHNHFVPVSNAYKTELGKRMRFL